MAGRVGSSPALLPIDVAIAGVGRPAQRFHFESIEDRAMVPQLVGLAALNAALESGGVGVNQTFRWTMRLVRHGAPTLTISDLAAGESPATDVPAALGGPLRFLYNNPYARLSLDSIQVAIDVVADRRQWTLKSARLARAACVRAPARVECGSSAGAAKPAR
jgi:hypothetical protein